MCLVKSPVLERVAALSLLERLRMLPDPRHWELGFDMELVPGRAVWALREAAGAANLAVLGILRVRGATSLFAPRDEADAPAGHLPCPVVLVYPGVEVRQECVVGDTAAMLALVSRDTRSLVVGAHTRG
ncbi:hypothetical protein ABZ545_06505 [Streptomyces abikoensis]|uniref:hypothetical protein n=1 Tax=Streptomyces abikoensis TaxID=97398 RepID=UPI0033FC006E